MTKSTAREFWCDTGIPTTRFYKFVKLAFCFGELFKSVQVKVGREVDINNYCVYFANIDNSFQPFCLKSGLVGT